MSRRGLSWCLLALVLGIALVVGASGDGGPPTDEDRAQRIAAGIRCPTCRSQSMADSDSPAARTGREEILRQVKDGRSDGEIRAYFVERFGDEVLLSPKRQGVGAVVWLLPVVAVVAAVGGLSVAFRRWRPKRRHATEDDRALVDEALRS